MSKFLSKSSLIITGIYLASFSSVYAEGETDILIKYNDTVQIKTIIEDATNLVVNLAGVVAILFIVYGGFTYITSAGNDKRVETAKKILTFAVLGLIVVILAKVIVFIVKGGVTSIIPQ